MNLQSPKKIFQKKTILDLKFKIPAYDSIMLWAEILKFQVQDSFLNIFFFGDWEIWKTNCTFWTEPPLVDWKDYKRKILFDNLPASTILVHP